jgi:branched-chain amino acid transport system ATP-binding protein
MAAEAAPGARRKRRRRGGFVMTTLHIDGVSKRFGGLLACSDVNMKVPAGEITGLIGPNGAGKTTVVNLITGVFSLTTGTIKFGENDLTTAPRHVVARAGIARTFQTIRLLPDASVLENVMIGMHRNEKVGLFPQLFGLPSALAETRRFRDEAMALLDRFGMTRYAEFDAGTLSYGDQRRVEMMRALASKPKLLLLDEPVAGMNDVEAYKLGEIFSQLASEGMGVLLIEHNIRFVSRQCRHIYVLDTGRLIAEGTPESVVNDPTVIKAYLGDDVDA